MPTTRLPGPQIWLQGDPAELEEMMQFGVDGLITNTIILKDLADQYGQLRGLLQRYLDISDKELVVEVDGDTFDDFMYAAEAAYSMSDRVLIKVPTKKIGIQAHARLRDLGVKTMATTVFSLSQAILAAAAGASWIAPFVGPTQAYGKDAIAFVAEIVAAFRNRPNAPGIIGGIVREPVAAHLSYAAGADAIVTFPSVYWEMLEHPGTTEWNDTFKGKWDDMETAGVLDGFVRSKTPAGAD